MTQNITLFLKINSAVDFNKIWQKILPAYVTWQQIQYSVYTHTLTIS